MHSLVRSAAKEAVSFGIRINGIAPGVIDTEMSRRSRGLFGSTATDIATIGRPGRPDEVASVAVLLASSLASYVVGEVANVDGGRSSPKSWFQNEFGVSAVDGAAAPGSCWT